MRAGERRPEVETVRAGAQQTQDFLPNRAQRGLDWATCSIVVLVWEGFIQEFLPVGTSWCSSGVSQMGQSPLVATERRVVCTTTDRKGKQLNFPLVSHKFPCGISLCISTPLVVHLHCRKSRHISFKYASDT